ncbi:hypothetical protein [Cupriavidus sp. TMH.W2]|uniref:secretion/conjugation apparatus DotM-related subunit n=1 Tax=Cupriavidus sp. TMH.W2 TaxID=3434465 RepID=UPI003D788BFA
MSSAQKSPAKATVDPFMLILGIGFLVLVAWLFWTRYHTAIATAYSYVRIAEFAAFVILSHWTCGVLGALLATAGVAGRFLPVLRRYSVPLLAVGLSLVAAWLVGSIFSQWFTFFLVSDKSLIEIGHMTQSSLHANLFTVFVCIIPLAIWMGRRSLYTNVTNHKNFARPKPYTLHTYTGAMGDMFPHGKLFQKLDLTKRSVNEGKYRMPDIEKQFVLMHKLMDRAKTDGEYTVNRERAGKVFSDQLGKLWRRSWKDLSATELVTLAILVPRIAATDQAMSDIDYDEALKAVNDLIADCWKQSEKYDPATDRFPLDTQKAAATLRKYAGRANVRQFMERHAYVSTIIYAMLDHARTLGVLQAAELRWLRVLDRRLFILLDNVGRQVAFAEVAGIYSHYLYESKRKRAAERPHVDGAVRGLIEAVDGFRFTEAEQQKIEETLNADKPVIIDPKAIERPVSNVFLHLLPVGHGTDRDIFEAALLTEDGKPIFESRCRPRTPVDQIVDAYNLEDHEVTALLTAPTSDDIRAKLMELCNKQGVVCYGADVTALIPGIERSAQTIRNLQTNPDHDVVMAAIEEGAADPEKHPQVSTAHAGAHLLRLLWVAREKRALREQANAQRGKAA